MKPIIILTLLAALASGCKKDNTNNESEGKQAERIMLSAGDLKPSNPANKFDSIGIWHNIGLDYVLSSLNERKQTSIEQVNQATIMFGKEVMNLKASPYLFASLNRVLADSAAHFRNIIAKAPLSEGGKTWLIHLFSAVEKVNPDKLDYAALKQNIMAIETSIIQDKSLNEHEKLAVLGTASVARYSASYWAKFQGFNPSSVGKLKHVIKFIAQVTSDMGGALVGFADTGTSGGMIEEAIDTSSAMAMYIMYMVP